MPNLDDGDRMALAIATIREYGCDSTKYPSIRLFVEHHLTELDADYWVANTGSGTPSHVDVLNALVADTTWVDLDDDGSTVDCTLPGGVTNYLLSVRFDRSGHCRSIEMES